MSSSENVTVTLKAAVGYDAPWIVVKGETPDQVAKHLAEAFGIDGRLVEEGTLHQVLLQANVAFQSGEAVASTLGGQVIVENGNPTASAGQAAEAAPKPARSRKKAEPEPQAPEPEKAPEKPVQEVLGGDDDLNADLLALVEAETTADGLLKLYHSNRAGFSAAPEALKALQVKGKALKGAK